MVEKRSGFMYTIQVSYGIQKITKLEIRGRCMKKRTWSSILSSLLVMATLVGCGSTQSSTDTATESNLNVGLVTSIGSIDDKSFNQGAWEGILQVEEEFKINKKYLQAAGETEADALKEIANFYDAGYNLIVAPGFGFGKTVYEAQQKYPEMNFIAIDTVAHNGDNVAVMADNSVAVLFAEHEAGFLAGVAAAVELQEGEVGFIGGMPTEAVQKYNWGFQQGIKYANEHYGTKMSMDPSNFVYQGTFTDIAAGQQISAQLYDKGVDVIFSAAGAVGSGVIKEATERAQRGGKVWVIGVDVDQYEDGIYGDAGSVILTSAMKKISTATYDVIKQTIQGTFPGGQILTYSAQNDGVGIPAENPNLSEDTTKIVDEVYAKIKAGEVSISDSGDGLIA